MTTRRKLSKVQRIRLFDKAGGTCEICGQKIQVGEKWELHHSRQLWLAGEDNPDNLVPVHVACHRQVSAKDNTTRAKTDRVRAKHLGIRRSSTPMPGSRASKFKRKLDGTVERRETPDERYDREVRALGRHRRNTGLKDE